VIVPDASAIVELLLDTPPGALVRARIRRSDETLHAPHLVDVEVAQVLRRFQLRGELSAGRGDQALRDLADLALARYPHQLLLPRIWQLRAALTAYEAAYVALAEALDAPLLTFDERLARTGGHRAQVEVPA
jgi:predicted nucleic acid-binding protein